MVVEEETIRIAEGRLLARGEGPLLVVGEGRHQLLGDALAPSQGVARGHSVGAVVELGQAQSRQLLGAMLHHALAHERRVKGHEALERFRQAREGENEIRIAALRLPALEHETKLGIERVRGQEGQSWSSLTLCRHGALTVMPPPAEVTMKFVSSCLAYAYGAQPVGDAGIRARNGPPVTPPTVWACVNCSREPGSAPNVV